MRQIAKRVVTFLTAEGGPTAVEYSVLLAMIIVTVNLLVDVLYVYLNPTIRLR